MGTKARQKPEHLAEKLVWIRTALGLSQNEMIRRLGVEEYVTQNIISNFELGKREPPLMILLQYARIAGVHMEVLVDDELGLPEKLPGPTNHEEIKRNFKSRRKIKR
jgi:transcriptional regulator with XRE-family HTH domain